MSRLSKVWYHIEPIFKLSNLYKLQQKHIYEGVLKIADEILEEKKSKNSQEDLEEIDLEFEDGGIRKPKIAVDQLLSAQNLLSHEEIHHEINTIIAAVSSFIFS